jgi:hypothetical protein
VEWFKRLLKKETEVKCEETVIENVTEDVKTLRATEDGHYLIDYNKVKTIDDIKWLLRFAVEKVPANHFRVEYIEHLIQTDDWYIDIYNYRVDRTRIIEGLMKNLEELQAIASKYVERDTEESETEEIKNV